MQVMILEHGDDINILDAVCDEYVAFHNSEEFGLTVSKDRGKAVLQSLMGGPLSCVLVMVHEDQVIGFAAGQAHYTHYGLQRVFSECFLFVSERYRRYAKRLEEGLAKWAKHAGCTHIILNASKAANAQADKVGKLYGHWNYLPYETAYIKEL